MIDGSCGSRKERLALVFPKEPLYGSLAVLVPESRLNELRELERARESKMWQVRAVVSDHIPLCGAVFESLERTLHTNFFLNENPISIYLHHGGMNAVYYDLEGSEDNLLRRVTVRVESDLPSNALIFARQPLCEMLDALALSHAQIPLNIARLELLSPRDGGILAYEVTLPFNTVIKFGPLGGIWHSRLFAPYDAIIREAIVSPSPFYRFLCAYRAYDGLSFLRRRIRELRDKLGVTDRMPKEPSVDLTKLRDHGFTEEFCATVRTTSDLFARLRDLRDAVAHFLVDRKKGQVPLNMADGETVYVYSSAAGILLEHVGATIKNLRIFFNRHIQSKMARGSVLPEPAVKDSFVVKQPK